MTDRLIIEGLMSTVGPGNVVHVTAMGAHVDRADDRVMELRPFFPSTTWDNLYGTRRGVFHMTDDMLQFARIVMRSEQPRVNWVTVEGKLFPLVEGACRWWALEATSFSDEGARGRIAARVVSYREERPFIGLHRARHAVLEAAILATRTHILSAGEIRRQLANVAPWVDKTGGRSERIAFAELSEYIERRLGGPSNPPDACLDSRQSGASNAGM